jgi:hypothetical protein
MPDEPTIQQLNQSLDQEQTSDSNDETASTDTTETTDTTKEPTRQQLNDRLNQEETTESGDGGGSSGTTDGSSGTTKEPTRQQLNQRLDQEQTTESGVETGSTDTTEETTGSTKEPTRQQLNDRLNLQTPQQQDTGSTGTTADSGSIDEIDSDTGPRYEPDFDPEQLASRSEDYEPEDIRAGPSGEFDPERTAKARAARVYDDEYPEADLQPTHFEVANGQVQLREEFFTQYFDRNTETDIQDSDVMQDDGAYRLTDQAFREEVSEQTGIEPQHIDIRPSGGVDPSDTRKNVAADIYDQQIEEKDINPDDILLSPTGPVLKENVEESILDQRQEENQAEIIQIDIPEQGQKAQDALEERDRPSSRRTLTMAEMQEAEEESKPLGERARTGLDDLRSDILDTTQPITEPVVETGDKIANIAEPVTDPITETGDEITETTSPVVDPVMNFGDEVQDEYDQKASAARETGSDVLDWTQEKLTDVGSASVETAGDLSQRRDVQLGTLAVTAAAPGTPPLSPAVIGRGAAFAGGLILTGAAVESNELQIPDQPDSVQQSEIDQPDERPMEQPEQTAPEQEPQNFESEISVSAGEENIIAPEELGIPRDQVESVSGGAEITEDGNIRIPIEATQVASQQRYEDGEEEDEEQNDEDEVGDEEIIIIEGQTGEDFLAEEEIPSEETGETGESTGAEDEEIVEISEPEQYQGVDDIDPVDQRNDELFEEQQPEPVIDPVSETQPEILQNQQTQIGTASLTPPPAGDFQLLGLEDEQEEKQPELADISAGESQVRDDGSLGAPTPDVLTGQITGVAQDQVTQPELTGQFLTPNLQQPQQGLLELQQVGQPQENLYEYQYAQVQEGMFAFGESTLTTDDTSRRIPRPRFGTLGSIGTGGDSADDGATSAGFETGIAPGWLSETVADIATVGMREDPISEQQLESADLSQQAPGELPTAEFFGEDETSEQISEVQDLFGVGSGGTGLDDFDIGLDIDEEEWIL